MSNKKYREKSLNFDDEDIARFSHKTTKNTRTISAITGNLITNNYSFGNNITVNDPIHFNGTTFFSDKLKMNYSDDKVKEIEEKDNNLNFLIDEFTELVESKNGIDSLEMKLLVKILKLLCDNKDKDEDEDDDEKPKRITKNK